MIDHLKLKRYNEFLLSNHLYDEGESSMHKTLTDEMIKRYIEPMKLQPDARILDIGCGPGYFLDGMRDLGFTNLIGSTLSSEDRRLCEAKGHIVVQFDMTNLPQQHGFTDESVDFIFARHVLEHSPYPIFTLLEWNRVLKSQGSVYIEIPSTDCERKHEFNPNHYSILGPTQLIALLIRTGFEVQLSETMKFKVSIEDRQYDEGVLIVQAKKIKGIDIR